MVPVTPYSSDTEGKMQRFFARLSEKDQRGYAAIEAAKLGYGGTEYVAKLFKIDHKTVRQGLADLDVPEDPSPGRVRKKKGAAEKA